jgi:hypothetical protein
MYEDFFRQWFAHSIQIERVGPGTAIRSRRTALSKFASGYAWRSSVHNKLLFFSQSRDIDATFRTGVSLHGHTTHSSENLGFIGKFLNEHCFLRSWIQKQARRIERESGIGLDFNRAYWTPPLTAKLAHILEAQQIEAIGLRPMVSLSDHDNIEAAKALRFVRGLESAPISVEWTVPFGKAVFHIGVHNMPSDIANHLTSILNEISANADERQIANVIAEMQSVPSLLLVFNHPVWNLNRIPEDVFEHDLKRFLQGAGRDLHAFELNGMRGHRENQRVIQLAAEWNRVLVSGGDRHGCEPNAILNLTNATEFSEFVEEVRNKKRSTLLVMSQYDTPLKWRFFRDLSDVICEYPAHPEGQRKWDERTFHPNLSGEIVCLKELWPKGSPAFFKRVFQMAILASSAPAHWTVRRLMSLENRESLVIPDDLLPAKIDRSSTRFPRANQILP